MLPLRRDSQCSRNCKFPNEKLLCLGYILAGTVLGVRKGSLLAACSDVVLCHVAEVQAPLR